MRKYFCFAYFNILWMKSLGALFWMRMTPLTPYHPGRAWRSAAIHKWLVEGFRNLDYGGLLTVAVCLTVASTMTGAAMSAVQFSLYWGRTIPIPGTLRFGDLALLSSLFSVSADFCNAVEKKHFVVCVLVMSRCKRKAKLVILILRLRKWQHVAGWEMVTS